MSLLERFYMIYETINKLSIIDVLVSGEEPEV